MVVFFLFRLFAMQSRRPMSSVLFCVNTRVQAPAIAAKTKSLRLYSAYRIDNHSCYIKHCSHKYGVEPIWLRFIAQATPYAIIWYRLYGYAVRIPLLPLRRRLMVVFFLFRLFDMQSRRPMSSVLFCFVSTPSLTCKKRRPEVVFSGVIAYSVRAS